jgi:nucleoside-diphosphate-sugar epimerase
MKFTVFGGRGFIGSHLADYLRGRGHDVWVPARDTSEIAGQNLGHVIYAIGLTGDFRSRPFDTIEANVGTLARLMQGTGFDSWLYISSTRLYGTGAGRAPCREGEPIALTPCADSLYDASKLLGETLCLSRPQESIRIARLSNVYGAGQSRHTFLGAIMADLKDRREVLIRESPQSSKDYIALSAVLPLLESIALHGRERIYNVASGELLSHGELASRLGELTGLPLRFMDGAQERVFPRIDISRIVQEFSFAPARLLSDLEQLLYNSGISVRGDRKT